MGFDFGKTNFFLTKKSRKLFLSKVKAQKIRWTTAWRRLNKKIKTDEVQKKRKRNEDTKIRDAAKEQAMREIKERRQKEIESKKKQRNTQFKDQKKGGGKAGKKK